MTDTAWAVIDNAFTYTPIVNEKVTNINCFCSSESTSQSIPIQIYDVTVLTNRTPQGAAVQITNVPVAPAAIEA